MTRTLSILAVAWFLVANQAKAGPIATAGESPANTELASLGGLLQALGAGVIGNGALIYPTGPSSHQRAEAEILASDTATRVLKKVKSVLKEGGLNDDENGDDESSKSITYLIKPALVFHKEELPPPNPLAGNVLPLPGGALLYTPTPTQNGGGANGNPTNGALANVKAAYGNLFAASPYTPSYTLNRPHAAVIIEEVTDILSLKSSLKRLEDEGEDVEDDSDNEEDDYGRKRHGRKSVEVAMLETIDPTSPVINPFTRSDFPFGLMTPPGLATTTSNKKAKSDEEGEEDVSVAKKAERKTIRRTINIRTTSTAGASSSGNQLSASVGKDGGITIVGNISTPSSTPQGSTIVIPAASLQLAASPSSSSSASPVTSASSSPSPASTSSAAPASSSSEASQNEAHEESKNDHSHADVGRMAAHTRKTPARPDLGDGVGVSGVRRHASPTELDPLLESSASGASPAESSASPASGSGSESASANSSPVSANSSSQPNSADSASSSEASRQVASPTVTLGSPTSDVHAEGSSSEGASAVSSGGPTRRKMHVVRVFEVKKKNGNGDTSSSLERFSVGSNLHKRDMMMTEEPEELTSIIENHEVSMAVRAASPTSGVQHKQRADAEEEEEDDEDDEDAGEDDEEKGSESKDAFSSSASPASASSSASAESAESSSASANSADSSSAMANTASSSVSANSVDSTSASVNSAESSSASVNSADSSSASANSAGSSSASANSADSSSASANLASSTSVLANSATSSSASANSADSSSASANSADSSSGSVKLASSSSASADLNTASQASSTATVNAASLATTGSSATAGSVHDAFPKSVDIETIGGENTSKSQAKDEKTASEDASSEGEKERKDDDSEEESDEESDSEDANKSKNGGKGGESDNESDDESEDEESTSAKKPKSMSEEKDEDEDEDDRNPLRAIQRVAAVGMREAEKAASDYVGHATSGFGEEMLSDESLSPHTPSNTADAPGKLILGAEPTASVGSMKRAADEASLLESTVDKHAGASSSSAERAAADKENEDEEEKDADNEDDDDDDDDDEKGDGTKSKSDNSDDDSDDEKSGKSAESDNESDDSDDSDSESSSEPRGKKAKKTGTADEKKSINIDSDDDVELRAAKKAESEAAAESKSQAVEVSVTHVENAHTESGASGDWLSGVGRDGASDLFSEHASDYGSDAAQARDIPAPTASLATMEPHTEINSDGDVIEYVTQIIPEESDEKAHNKEAPSVVVLASIDEEYEEEYGTQGHSGKPGAKNTASEQGSDAEHTAVQRNAVDVVEGKDKDAYVDADLDVRGVEPTPDVGAVKENQNRAMNIGLGNLRRHV
ncbi:hypothetical protein GQ54DRAFT_338010 [Martensiomyces pterosporus]|nr:hypothetical protein GQ54DRAFT_338010 [Martensiomyces pterosporus]